MSAAPATHSSPQVRPAQGCYQGQRDLGSSPPDAGGDYYISNHGLGFTNYCSGAALPVLLVQLPV